MNLRERTKNEAVRLDGLRLLPSRRNTQGAYDCAFRADDGDGWASRRYFFQNQVR